ncbi:unnamed protein product [Polarella glacialis]|uniref:D-alanine--D-alanine ligase C-terminal domain-containing protein n=1 Tax=Polarella glacialis TaxID=89957 RepID=A0A813D4U6_POLGL|nr:unnamed protein product [Polarella glacialis]CAE8738424.1 unnamed protein product [Polarella glacialis]
MAVLEMDDMSLQLLPCIEYFLSEEDPIRTSDHKLVIDKSGKPVGFAASGRKCPADIDETLREKLRDLATRSHKALGCRDYSLYDARFDPQGEPYFIEACLYCSFAPKSVIVTMTAQAGQDQRTVFEMLVNRAINQKKAAGCELKDSWDEGLGGHLVASTFFPTSFGSHTTAIHLIVLRRMLWQNRAGGRRLTGFFFLFFTGATCANFLLLPVSSSDSEDFSFELSFRVEWQGTIYRYFRLAIILDFNNFQCTAAGPPHLGPCNLEQHLRHVKTR